MKRLAIDVCVSWRLELELWRAGYEVAVRAMPGEPDDTWILRAVKRKCHCVISRDRGVTIHAATLGMQYVHLDAFGDSEYQHQQVLDKLECLEGRQ